MLDDDERKSRVFDYIRKSWPHELTQCASSMTNRASCLRRNKSRKRSRNWPLLTICVESSVCQPRRIKVAAGDAHLLRRHVSEASLWRVRTQAIHCETTIGGGHGRVEEHDGDLEKRCKSVSSLNPSAASLTTGVGLHPCQSTLSFGPKSNSRAATRQSRLPSSCPN